MTLIFAVSGKKQSGKTTLVNRFLKELENEDIVVKEYSFADDIKKFLVDVMGLREEQVNGTDEDKNSPTEYHWDSIPFSIKQKFQMPDGFISARNLMQIFGTDLMREMFDDSIWVKSVFRAIDRDKPDIAIIPDTRFPSEIHSILENGGKVIRLTRDVSKGDAHSSEIALDDWDWDVAPCHCDNTFVIPNNLDMQETWEYAEDFIQRIRKSR